jgi:hypothetical protein
MRFLTIATAALAAAQGAFAVDIQKAIIMSFPHETPDDVVNRAMDEIRKAGGTVTHEYKLLKYEASFNSPYTRRLPIALCSGKRAYAFSLMLLELRR